MRLFPKGPVRNRAKAFLIAALFLVLVACVLFGVRI